MLIALAARTPSKSSSSPSRPRRGANAPRAGGGAHPRKPAARPDLLADQLRLRLPGRFLLLIAKGLARNTASKALSTTVFFGIARG